MSTNPSMPVRTPKSQNLMAAADVAREIANRLRKKADEKTGDDRKHWRAMSAGAQMVGVRLVEKADDADGNPNMAMREAHRQAAMALRQHAEAGDGLADDEVESDAIAAALRELADQHDQAAGDTRPQLSGGGQ